MARRIGRPKLPDDKKRLPRVRLILTGREAQYIELYATEDQATPATWCRDLVLDEVRRRIAETAKAG